MITTGKTDYSTDKTNWIIRVSVYYCKGNGYIGGEKRGYYASFSAVERKLWNGEYTLETMTAGHGFRVFCGEVERKSAKNENVAIEKINQNIDYYLEKIQEKTGLKIVE